MKSNESLILSRQDIYRLIDAMDYQRWNDRELSAEDIKSMDSLCTILKQKERELVYEQQS